MSWVWAAIRAVETPRYWLPPSARSGSMALLRLGFQVVSLAPVATEGSTDAQGLASHLGLCWWGRGMLSLGQADLSSLCCHWGCGGIQAQAAAKGHFYICGPATAGVCADVHDLC